MGHTGHGKNRYPHRAPAALADTGLGPAMRPQDIFVQLRRIADLRDDHDTVDIMRLGAAALHTQPTLAMELTPAEIDAAIAQAAEVTPSRVVAWRRRSREMTWLELRVLLIGLSLEGRRDG